MRLSKIEEFNLQSQLLPIFNKTDRNVKETARRLSEISGVKISNMAVTRYLDKIKESISQEIPKVRDTKEAVAKMMAEDRDQVIGEYTRLLETQIQEINTILQNKNEDPAKKVSLINSLIGPKGSMVRAMNAVGFGNQAQTQVNVQVNFVQDRIKEIAKIIVEECNGSSERVVKRLELLS